MNRNDQEDFLDAVSALEDKQKLTLYNFSARLLEGTRYSCGMDLLYEVIDRVLSGSRVWRRDIPIGAFLHESMRSLASVDRRAPDRRPLSFEDWMTTAADAGREPYDAFALSPEETLIKKQEELALREVFDAAKSRLAHNENALIVFRALAEEMTPAETREAYGLSEAEYKSARARIAKVIRAQGAGPRH